MDTSDVVLEIDGGGIYFWWMIGVMAELCADPELQSKYTLRGASAGALAAVLGTCQVPSHEALRCAYSLSVEKGVFDRKLGLVGVWRDLVSRWLDSILPADAAQRCSGNVHVTMIKVPSFKKTTLSHFENRRELIDACLASTHVPFIMDGHFCTKFRGQRVVDGALIDVAKELFVSWLPPVSIHAPFNISRQCKQLESSDQKLKLRRISHKDDSKLLHRFQNRSSFSIMNLQDIRTMVDMGRLFGRNLRM